VSESNCSKQTEVRSWKYCCNETTFRESLNPKEPTVFSRKSYGPQEITWMLTRKELGRRGEGGGRSPIGWR
jgi:hypothetical protein